jgi:hypothetical protein
MALNVAFSVLGGSSSAADTFASSNSLMRSLGQNLITPKVQPETAAVLRAKAQFTAPVVLPPWLNANGNPATSPTLSAVKSLKTFVDPKADSTLPVDLQQAFTAYRALDRMKVVAKAATSTGLSATERSALDQQFKKGLTDLRVYLSSLSPDKLKMYFDAPSRLAVSDVIPRSTLPTTNFLKGALATRTTAIDTLTGTEVVNLNVVKAGRTYQVQTDLSTIELPRTLDKIARALNAAIVAVPATASNGDPVIGNDGQPIGALSSRFSVKSVGGKWGLALQSGAGEAVWVTPPSNQDGLMVISSRQTDSKIAPVQIGRIDNAINQAAYRTAASLSAIDSAATARAQLTNSRAASLQTSVDIKGAVTDSDGNTFMLGQTAGAMDDVSAAGMQEMFLRKVNPSGTLLWQRPILNASSTDASAIALTPSGQVVVTGSVIGSKAEANARNGDIFVARFSPEGAEMMRQTTQMAGDQRPTAVATDAAGNIFVTSKNGSNGSMLIKYDATGKESNRTTFANTSLAAVQVGADGLPIVLTRSADGTSLVQRLDGQLNAVGQPLNLGQMQPSDMAIGPDGTIAVSGETTDSDVVVSLIDAGLTSERRVTIGTAASERADSLIYDDGFFFVGGRTAGALGEYRTGIVDGFVARIDPQTAQLVSTTQFGKPGTTTGPVAIAKSAASSSTLETLGLGTGRLTPAVENLLVNTTRLKVGDNFSVNLDGGKYSKISIAQDETISSLAAKVRKALGTKVAVTTLTSGNGLTLRVQPSTGHAVQLQAGPDGQDALAKLGLKVSRLYAAPPASAKDPAVVPGGQYGLALSDVMSLGSLADAKAALMKVSSAASTTQTAYRTLYWDANKAARVDGAGASSVLSANQKSQLQQYQAAIYRLGG